jgi:hypothetical protein
MLSIILVEEVMSLLVDPKRTWLTRGSRMRYHDLY